MRWMWIDRILELDSNERLVAVKNVSLAEEYLHDHFPAGRIDSLLGAAFSFPFDPDPHVTECECSELPNGVGDSRSEYVVGGVVLLEHGPHGPHIVPGKTPVSTCVQVPEA